MCRLQARTRALCVFSSTRVGGGRFILFSSALRVNAPYTARLYDINSARARGCVRIFHVDAAASR